MAENSNITTTETGSISLKAGETKTYEIMFQLNDGAPAITDASISVSFDFIEGSINYSFFKFETADGQPSDSQNGTVIAGLDTANYTSETRPETLIIPAYNESGELLTIATGNYSDSIFNGLVSPTVILQNGLTSIGNFAFSDCTSLTSIEIPSSVTSIGYYTFDGCSNLTSIEIPSGVTSIDDCVFRGCSSLTSIELPNSVTYLGNAVFLGCSNLTSIEIPRGVIRIGIQAFSGCNGLTSIEIPSSVTSIGDSAFSDCSGLKYIHLSGNLTNAYSLSGTWQYSATELTTPTFSTTTSSMESAGWYYQQSAWNA